MKNKRAGLFAGFSALILLSVSVLFSRSVVLLAGRNQQFSIAAFPPMAVTAPGGPAVKYTAVLASQGYSGKVLLSCKSNSPGVVCSVTPSSVQVDPETSASAEMIAAAVGREAAGSYHLTITGTTDNASDHRSTTVTLMVR